MRGITEMICIYIDDFMSWEETNGQKEPRLEISILIKSKGCSNDLGISVLINNVQEWVWNIQVSSCSGIKGEKCEEARHNLISKTKLIRNNQNANIRIAKKYLENFSI